MKLIVTSEKLPLLLLEVERAIEAGFEEDNYTAVPASLIVDRLNAVLEFWLEPEFQEFNAGGESADSGLYRFCKDFNRIHFKLLIEFFSEITDLVRHLLIGHKFKRISFVETKSIEVLDDDGAVFIEIS